MTNTPQILVFLGPTASGKTALALECARRFHGEVVSADSMQLYRGLDIGTAKPSPEEQKEIPHHLLGVLDTEIRADVYWFCREAEMAIAQIRARGKLPIIAGGTGMYIRALLYGLDNLPGDAALRKTLDAQYDSEEGYEALAQRMQTLDPKAFEKFKTHRRKLIRALEVRLISGKSILELQNQCERKLRFPVKAFFLDWDREELKKRIRLRTHLMLEAGWIQEAQSAIAAGLLETPTAWQAIGYKEIGEYLHGNLSYQELEERISTVTWQFARRQLTWFRHQHPEAERLSMPFDGNWSRFRE